ncbi:hypothetical protein HanXRQr2_Chr17g0818431 [Helianthus annuus]|uniref:Uncharacterized protein n=1 Tax=Helianthus annuus TaxID=4232 RepID=A0A9K3GV99_HELAN|nr:hypothetical protein HanXRQr2_Chr17g0818431 [Helianthus annuus]
MRGPYAQKKDLHQTSRSPARMTRATPTSKQKAIMCSTPTYNEGRFKAAWARNMNNKWEDEEEDPTYKESTVFSRLHPKHSSYKPATRAGYNPKAEHDYTLSYRPDDMAEDSKFIRKIATAAIDKTKLPHNVGKYNDLTGPDDHLQVFKGAGATGGWNLPT